VEFSALDNRLGETQGRVQLPSGEVRLVLGDLDPGRLEHLEPGDQVELFQEVDLSGVTLVRVQGELVVRSCPFLWEVAVVVDGAIHARLLTGAHRRRPVDLAAHVSKLGGKHTVGARLSLVAL